MEFVASTVPATCMSAHSAPVQSIAFNHTGKVFATGDTMRVVRAWLNQTPVLDANLQSENLKVRAADRIRGIAFSHHGESIYVACGDTLRAFDLLLRREVWSFQPPRTFGFLVTSPMSVAVSPAGNVATVSDVGLVTILDAEGQILTEWSDNEAPRHLAFTGDGPNIVGADGFSVSVWEPYTGCRLRHVATRERIYGMALDSLRGVVAVRTLHSVLLMDALTLDTIGRLPAPTGLPLIAFSPEGGHLALAGKEEVLLLEIASGNCTVLPVFGARVVSIAFHPAGTHLSAGCSDGQLRFWKCQPYDLL